MKKKEKDEQLARILPGLIRYHETMLTDGLRNKLLYKAIKTHVNADTRFLDVGAGTGVWAIIAAKLGAKRVVAVEIEEALIPVIFKHAQENGVADRIEIVHGDSNDLKLRERFDVIVSELFGSDALSPRVVESFVDLRNRFLAPGGTLIPQALISYAVPVFAESLSREVPTDLPVAASYVKSLGVNHMLGVDLDQRGKILFLAEPQRLVTLDFTTIESAPPLDLTGSWKLRNIAKANAFAMFTGSVFSEGIQMDGFASQSWGTTLYPFEPLAVKAGILRLDLKLDDKKTIWTVSVPSRSDIPSRTQSPAFSLARIIMGQQTTPHKTVRKTKKTATTR